MAPSEIAKVQRNIVKETPSKGRASPVGVTKKKTVEKTPLKLIGSVANLPTTKRQRTCTVPKVATPKPKENKSVPILSSVTKSAKKATWKKRPKPAHSGVPVPEKMKRLMEKELNNPEFAISKFH